MGVGGRMKIDLLTVTCGGDSVYIEDADSNDPSVKLMCEIAQSCSESDPGNGRCHLTIVLRNENIVRQRFGWLQAKYPSHLAGKRHVEALSMKCEDLPLPKYLKKALKEGAVLHAHQLVGQTTTQLLSLEGVGRKGVVFIEGCLRDLDLQPGMDLTQVQDRLPM